MTLVEISPRRRIDFNFRADYADPASGRPVVDVEFAATDPDGILLGSLETGALVDSGARMALLGLRDAFDLGLDLSDPRYLRGRLGGVVPNVGMPVAFAQIKVRLGTSWLDIPAAFSLGMAPVRIVLGREGVFDQVLFGFEHDQRTVLARVR